jgi:hypothetical protein
MNLARWLRGEQSSRAQQVAHVLEESDEIRGEVFRLLGRLEAAVERLEQLATQTERGRGDDGGGAGAADR